MQPGLFDGEGRLWGCAELPRGGFGAHHDVSAPEPGRREQYGSMLMKTTILAVALAGTSALTAPAALADPVEYTIDPSHTAAAFQWTHAGFSTTYGIITNAEGTIMFDADDPANSSVQVTMSLDDFDTGRTDRDEHFLQ
ncbi:MAG: hypothetical protein GVX90_06550, partial [Alphaproteobacteria bacterium]|nr:hypothetical protein [Alphaproteobacteria bacterium]